MTPIDFRAADLSDREAILSLRARAFAEDDVEKREPDFWQWEFVDGYAGPARVFVATSGERVVAHFAFIPQRYGEVRGALAVDVMTDPEFRRQKLFSRLAVFAADQIRNDFQVVTAFQIREAVRAGMERGGWRETMKLPVLVRPLWPRRRITPDDSIRALTDADFDQVDRLVAASGPRQHRTADFLRWRYRQNPRWRYELDGLFENGELRAFVVHRPTVLKGFRTLAIADAGFASSEAFRRLIRHVCRRGATMKLTLAAAMMSKHHPAYAALRRNFFFPGPHRFNLLLQVFDPRLRDLARLPWSLSWGDTDHL